MFIGGSGDGGWVFINYAVGKGLWIAERLGPGLIVTPAGELMITAGDLEVAQFVYLLLNNINNTLAMPYPLSPPSNQRTAPAAALTSVAEFGFLMVGRIYGDWPRVTDDLRGWSMADVCVHDLIIRSGQPICQYPVVDYFSCQ